VAGLRWRRASRGHRNRYHVALATLECIALISHTMIGSQATLEGVVACYAVHSIYVVLAAATEHPVRATSALQEVSVGSAVERIRSGSAVDIAPAGNPFMTSWVAQLAISSPLSSAAVSGVVCSVRAGVSVSGGQTPSVSR
jgi:hypothetical protein